MNILQNYSVLIKNKTKQAYPKCVLVWKINNFHIFYIFKAEIKLEFQLIKKEISIEVIDKKASVGRYLYMR